MDMDIKKTNKNSGAVKIKVNHFTDRVDPVKPITAPQLVEPPKKADVDLEIDNWEDEETPFKTPEQASAEDSITGDKDLDMKLDSDKDNKPKKRNPIAWFKSLSKKKKIIISVIAVLVLLLIAAALYLLVFNGKNKQSIIPTKKITVKKVVVPTTVPSTLTGLPVSPDVNKRQVTAVMIENSLDARPQSGLDQAGVVFEAIAEGGVTRFMGIFQDTQPDYVGPIRSARPYYVSWLMGFDAAYAHVGGSPDALADISAWGVKDLNQFANGGSYQRISSRYAPHNVYTSIATLNTLETSKGYTSSTYTGFDRKKDAPIKTPTASNINFKLSGFYYDPSFTYNPSTNNYTRSENGIVHTELDAAGKPSNITPKVVIGMITPLGQGALDSSGAYYSNYTTIGSGNANIFQDGEVTKATWTKASNTDQIKFTDAAGKPVKLNAGQTWITAVSSDGGVSYK